MKITKTFATNPSQISQPLPAERKAGTAEREQVPTDFFEPGSLHVRVSASRTISERKACLFVSEVLARGNRQPS